MEEREMEKTAIVVVACHFLNPTALCETTKERLYEALGGTCASRGLGSPQDFVFVVTGDVPYHRGTPTLGQLMRTFLVEWGINSECIVLGKGVGTFSEARSVSIDLRRMGITKAVVFSSNWYFWSAVPIWRKFAKTHGIDVEFQSVYGTGGWRTKIFYLCYAAVIHLAFLLGLEEKAEEILTRSQSARVEGFTWDGCH